MRLAGQRPQHPQRRPGDGLGRPPGEATPKDRQLGKNFALGFTHSLPGVIEDGPDAAMPLRHITHLSLQQIKALLNLGRDVIQRKRIHPRSGQFDTQRHPFNQAADAGQIG